MLACPSKPVPVRVGQRDATELVSVDALDPVVLGPNADSGRIVRFSRSATLRPRAACCRPPSSVSFASAWRRFSSKFGRVAGDPAIIRSILRKTVLAGGLLYPAPCERESSACAAPDSDITLSLSCRARRPQEFVVRDAAHRKNDSRDASSRSLTLCALPGAAFGASFRERERGRTTSTFCSASLRPPQALLWAPCR